MSLMFDFDETYVYAGSFENLIRLEKLIKSIIPFSNYYYCINVGVHTLRTAQYQNIIRILNEVRQQFGVDTRGLTEAQGRLFLSHWFLLLRDFDVSEMTVYIKSLTGEKDGDNKGKVHGESAFSQLQDKAV